MLTFSDIGGASTPCLAAYCVRYSVNSGMRLGTGWVTMVISAAPMLTQEVIESGDPATAYSRPRNDRGGRGRSSVRGCG